VAFVASMRDREARVLATPLGPAGRIRVGVVAIREALVLGSGARPRVGFFAHGLRASRARRLLRGRHEASDSSAGRSSRRTRLARAATQEDVAPVASMRDRVVRVLATPLGPAGRVRVGVVAIRDALVLGSGARPRVGLCVHGLRASRARRLLQGRHEAPGRSAGRSSRRTRLVRAATQRTSWRMRDLEERDQRRTRFVERRGKQGRSCIVA
jgi:hypothetical protein